MVVVQCKLDDPKIQILTELVIKYPDATHDELREMQLRRHRVSGSINTIWRTMERVENISKKSCQAQEADKEERAAFREKQLTLPTIRTWFMDEFGIHLGLSRSRVRARRGKRTNAVEPFRTGSKISANSTFVCFSLSIATRIRILRSNEYGFRIANSFNEN